MNKNINKVLYLIITISLILGFIFGYYILPKVFHKQSSVLLNQGSVLGVASDRILIQFKKTTNSTAKRKFLLKHKVKSNGKIRKTQIETLTVPLNYTSDTFVEKIKNEDMSLVQFVETDKLILPEMTINDPFSANQWHLSKIESYSAWDYISTGGTIIGICDTGFDATHPDLQNILIASMGYNTVDNSQNWIPVNNHPHGTMVAGAAAGEINNNFGIAGVGLSVRVIPVRITNMIDGAAYISDAAECISYVSEKGARAINISYRMADSAAIHSAAQYAETRGAITVVSAGNDGIDTGWPDYDSFIAVAATDKNDTKATFSNYGTYIDIVAPGVGIYTSSIGSQFALVSGTSLSAPLVTGTIALMINAKSSLTSSQVKSFLFQSADHILSSGEDLYYGSGRLNSKKAVMYVLNITNSPTPTIISTNTPTPSLVPSITKFPTMVPSATPTNSLSPTSTQYPTNTPMPTITLKPTSTPRPTKTPTPIVLKYVCAPGGGQEGSCEVYFNPIRSGCPITFRNDPTCGNLCFDEQYRCKNASGKNFPRK